MAFQFGQAPAGRGFVPGRALAGAQPGGPQQGAGAVRGRGFRGGRGGPARGRGPRGGGPGGPGPVGPGAGGAPPGGPAPAGGAPAPAPAPIRSRAEVIDGWRRNFVYRVSQQNAQNIRDRLGVTVQVVPVGAAGVNPHELLAVARTMATVWGMAELALNHDTIDIRFHARRDIVISQSLNGALQRAGYGTAAAPLITFNYRDGHVTSHDINRRRAADVPGPKASAAFYMDVYYGPNGTGMQPTDLLDYHEPYDEALWIGHQFDGPFGSLDTAGWCRRGGDVRWKPDPVSDGYAAHPSCEAMATSGANGQVAWAKCHTWSLDNKCLYYVIRAVRSPLVRPIEHLVYSRGMNLTLAIPDVDNLERRLEGVLPQAVARGITSVARVLDEQAGGTIIRRKRFICTLSHFTKARSFVEQRGRSSWTLSSLSSMVGTILDGDQEFQLLLQYFPIEFVGYRTDLIIAAFTYDARRDALSFESIRSTHAIDFASINESRNGIDRTPASAIDYSRWALYGVIAIAGIYLARKFSGVLLTHYAQKFKSCVQSFVDRFFPASAVQALADVQANGCAVLLQDVIFAPLAEEAFKRIIPDHRYKIGASLLVAFLDCKRHNRFDALMRQSLLHLVMTYCPNYWAGVATHAAFNAGVHINTLQAGWIAHRKMTNLIPASVSEPSMVALTHMLDRIDLSYVTPNTFDRENAMMTRTDLFTAEADERFNQLVTACAVKDCFVKATVSTKNDPIEIDPTVQIDDPDSLLSFMEDDPTTFGTQGYYKIFSLEVPMFRPATCATNMKQVIKYRLMKKPKYTTTYPIWRSSACLFSNAPFGIHGTSTRWINVDLDYVDFGQRTHLYNTFKRGAVDIHATPAEWRSYDFGQAYDLYNVIPHDLSDVSVAAWLEHTDPAKRERYVKAFDKVKCNPITNLNDKRVKSIQVNIKSDEVLMKPDFAPRPIHAVDPQLVVTLGPAVYENTSRIKEDWWFKIVCMEDKNGELYVLTITWGAGRTADELDAWFRKATSSPGIHIIGGGDDGFAIQTMLSIRRGIYYRFWELDLAMCDHTNREEALEHQYTIMRMYGAARETIALMEKNAHATLVCGLRQADKGSVRLTRGAERNTGGVDTTLGNTINVMLAVAAIFFECWETLIVKDPNMGNIELQDLINNGAALFGFEMKCRADQGSLDQFMSGHVAWGTFLKGIWLPCVRDVVYIDERGDAYPANLGCEGEIDVLFAWTPVLGRYAKLSKTLSFPPKTYKLPCDKLPPSMMVAMERHMVSVAKSMAPFSLPIWIRRWFESFGTDTDKALVAPAVIEAYKVQSGSARVLDEQRALVALACHYRCDPILIQDWFFHLTYVRVMTHSTHPFWRVAVERDYA